MYIFVKTIAIGWIYGVNKFANNVEQMTGMLPNKYWVVCWSVVAPIVMGVIFLFYCFKASYVLYDINPIQRVPTKTSRIFLTNPTL